MNISKFLCLLLVLFSNILNAQTLCTNNLIPNGDLSQGTTSRRDNDINNAVGFSVIWSGGSSADFYSGQYSPLSISHQPVTGNYVSFWVASNNTPTSSSFNREGFKFELSQPLAPNSGTYTFTFDMACISGWGNAELGIYGIYNPSNSLAATPTAFNIPTNVQLFGAANTIAFPPVTISVCNNNMTSQTITINTNDPDFPIGGITHIFLASSGNQLGGAHYSVFDNFCLQSNSISPPPTASVCNFTNGGLEQGTTSNNDNDIDNAVDFSRIWPNGSTADFYSANSSVLTASPPQPATGNYTGFWVGSNNAPTADVSHREGFKVKLGTPIAPNSGYYELTFETASLMGWGIAELGVYGIYNPSNAHSVQPTSFGNPSNMQLYGSFVTVAFSPIRLTTVSNSKVQRTIRINSHDPSFPIGGITHLFFTASENQTSGGHYVAFDNFCLNSIPDPCPTVFGRPTIFCIPDQDGDGLPEYMVRFSTIEPGSIEISSSCLPNSPLTFTSPRINSVIINSSQNCSNATLHYILRDGTNNICDIGQFTVRLGECDGVFPLRPDVIQPVTAFPNPATRQLNLTWEAEKTPLVQIQILDIQGRVCKQYTNVDGWAGQWTISVQDLQAGLYQIKVSGEGYAPTPVKFLKQ